jgi:hypothetical protein
MEKKLRVKMSTFQTTLTFNEWVDKYNVSSGYIEPTKYFQGNAGSRRMTMDTRLELQLSRESELRRESPEGKKRNLLGKIISLISF